MSREVVVVNSISKTERRIQLVNSPKRNVMGDIHKEFTREEVKQAKIEDKTKFW